MTENYPHQCLGKHFSQTTLSPSLQAIRFGQPFIFKVLLTTLLVILAVTAGCLTGTLSAALIFNFLGTTSLTYTVFTAISMLLIISIWIHHIVYCSLASSLWRTGLIAVLAVVLSVFVTRNTSVAASIFLLTILSLSCISLSLLTCALSLSLISFLFQNKTIKALYILLTITISVSFAFFTPVPKDPLFFRMVAAGVLSYVILKASKNISASFYPKSTSDFRFIKIWSIALASWGGTSFYNLDLSGVDFSGSHLANCDFRARTLYRTCLKGVTGLDRARVDDRYFDLAQPKVQELLTQGYSDVKDFSRTNLRGAFLQQAKMQQMDLTEANLDGADLRGADLRNCILLRSQVTGADFTGANLTGICIKDWSTNSETCLATVQCDYIYREFERGQPVDRYPVDRNFEPGEFENLFQKVRNAVELVFKDGVNLRALSFAFQKVELEDEGLGLQLKGIEQRGDLWIVKVTHREGVSRQEVEQQLSNNYKLLEAQLAAKDQQILQLMGITRSLAAAAESYSKKPFGNNFVISGSTITNLAGSGQIEYEEAASQVRQLVTGQRTSDPTMTAQQVLAHLENKLIATTPHAQTELVEQVILAEAEKDWFFKQVLLQQEQEIISTMPEESLAIAFKQAIDRLRAAS